jgi:hypothetical protein
LSDLVFQLLALGAGLVLVLATLYSVRMYLEI